jgi:uncharacterized protein YeaO (DUF488 family)
MGVRVVRLGSDRVADEGLRIGTVRRPPRGVRKNEYALKNIYDVWLPTLSPSEMLLKEFFPIGDDQARWRAFRRRFLSEMKGSAPAHDLDLLAALSHQSNFSVGCYCEHEALCHRSLLRALLQARGALVRATGCP